MSSLSVELSIDKISLKFPKPVCNFCSVLPTVKQSYSAKSPKTLKAFQGQLKTLLPVDHSIAYSPDGSQEKDTPIWGIHAWHLLIKWSKQFFYQLHSNCGRKLAQSLSLVETFTIDKFKTFQCLPLFFQNNSRTFSVFWNSRTFQDRRWVQDWRRNTALCKTTHPENFTEIPEICQKSEENARLSRSRTWNTIRFTPKVNQFSTYSSGSWSRNFKISLCLCPV